MKAQSIVWSAGVTEVELIFPLCFWLLYVYPVVDPVSLTTLRHAIILRCLGTHGRCDTRHISECACKEEACTESDIVAFQEQLLRTSPHSAKVVSRGWHTFIQLITILVPTLPSPTHSALRGHKFVQNPAHIWSLRFILNGFNIVYLLGYNFIWGAATLGIWSVVREGEKAKHGHGKLRSNIQSST